ncbi:MAG: TSUP family transporter [Actinomycetota bacterium]|nr:TSUP family transporter [Actinomycetota bacterium]
MNGVALYAALVAFGLFTGGAAGLLGVGGGIMMVPFLTLVAGVSQHAAQATSLLVVLPTAIVATWVLHRKGIGDVRVALAFGTLGAIGGVLGALLALALPGHTLRIVFALFLAGVAVRLVRDGLRGSA